MKVHELTNAAAGAQRMLAVVLAKGEEVMTELKRFARERGVGTCRITAVGAFERAKLGYYDRQRKEYLPIPVSEQAEVLALVGDIADDEHGQPAIHLHAVLGLRDGSTRGGHLLEAIVWPTLEVIVTEAPAHLRKRFDKEAGLALLAAE